MDSVLVNHNLSCRLSFSVNCVIMGIIKQLSKSMHSNCKTSSHRVKRVSLVRRAIQDSLHNALSRCIFTFTIRKCDKFIVWDCSNLKLLQRWYSQTHAKPPELMHAHLVTSVRHQKSQWHRVRTSAAFKTIKLNADRVAKRRVVNKVWVSVAWNWV